MRADSIFMYVIDSTSIYSADYIGNRKPAAQEEVTEELLIEEPVPGKSAPEATAPEETVPEGGATPDETPREAAPVADTLADGGSGAGAYGSRSNGAGDGRDGACLRRRRGYGSAGRSLAARTAQGAA